MTAQLSYWLAFALVFATVFMAGWGVISAVGGATQRRLRVRLAMLRDDTGDGVKPASMIREKYLRRLSPVERLLEELPGMRRLSRMAEQAGHLTPAYRIVITCIVTGLAAGIVTALITGRPVLAAMAAAAALPLPLLRIVIRRNERIAKFEEQLPDALDMMSRALRAGMPLTECLKFVAEEMTGAIAEEFRTTWSHINYGIGMRASFDDLLERMPSISLRAMTTAVLVQRETGGNLSEILDKIAKVLRARFRFERRLKTLTAEGRMSAWVLILMPLVLAGILSVTSPDYLPMLTGDPLGMKLIIGAVVMGLIGIWWIRNVIRVRV